MIKSNQRFPAWHDAPLVDLDTLPRSSPWPARLLGLSPWKPHPKTETELYREYETEFFAPCLAKAQAEYPAATYRQWFEGHTGKSPASPCLTEGGIRLLTPRQQLDTCIELIESTLLGLMPAKAIVDLGAGTGKVPFCLAERNRLTGIPLYALEYSESGRELIRHFARNSGIDLIVGGCNFLKRPLTDTPIPVGSVLLTSITVSCLPQCGRQFLLALRDMSPRAVVHLEPCVDLLNDSSLHHLLCRRYFEVNGYNSELHPALRTMESEGLIRLTTIRTHVFGSNPLLPSSLLVWKPV